MTDIPLPDPAADAGQETMVLDPVYMVQRDFRQSVNGVTVFYRQGQVIRDPQKVVDLKTQRAPIEIVRDEADLVVCPHCHMSFSLRVVKGAQSLLERAKSLGMRL